MTGFLTAMAAFVAAAAGLGLLRLLRGPSPVDRMMAVQLAGTAGASVCLLLSVAQASPALVDVALIPAVLAALGTAATSRSGRPAGNESPVAPPARFRLPCGLHVRGGGLRSGASLAPLRLPPSHRARPCVDNQAPAFRAMENAA